MYFSPSSQNSVTMFSSSGCASWTRRAATRFAPLLGPTNSPCSREVPHGPDGFFGGHAQDVVHQFAVAPEDTGHETVGDALYQVLPHLAAQDRARLVGLHREE